MTNNVFILGAGASAAAGVPMMDKFLDRARDLAESNQTDVDKDAFDLIFSALDILPQTHSKATLDIDNVESVFSALEMARIVGLFGDFPAEQIPKLDDAMRRVIATTIENSMVIRSSGKQAIPPEPYYEFASLVHRLVTSHPRHSATIVTFNYDLAVDYALHFVGLPVSYGFAEDDPADGLPLLKLHGSLNWAECTHCQDVVPWRLHKYFQNYGWHDLDLVKKVRLSVSRHLRQFSYHDWVTASAPVVVPPTWGKASQHLRLAKVWNGAARALQTAENIFIVGYSLPPSDAFFKYLYALGTIGKTRIRRFWVFNPDSKVDSRYRELLGQSVQSRYQFQAVKFDEAIKVIEAEFPA